MRVNFKYYSCRLEFGQYSNGNTAIRLLGSGPEFYEGELIAVATVNVDPVEEHIVGIKNWAENEGMVKDLIKSNVIEEELLFTKPTGFVEVEYYKLTDQALAVLEKQKEAAI